MEYLRVHGYPVPAVQELTDNQTNLIMERIQGPSMVDYLSRHPWMIRRQGHILAALHQQLHEVPPPDFLPAVPIGQGDAFLHIGPSSAQRDDRPERAGGHRLDQCRTGRSRQSTWPWPTCS